MPINTSSDLFYANQNGSVSNVSLCSGNDSSMYLEFLPNDQIGIVQGANTLAALGFSDIAIPVTAYSMQTKVIGAQEVVFIPGLVKGLTTEIQEFPYDVQYTTPSSIDKYFMKLDISVNYYSNFRYISTAVCASANYDSGINVTNAMNIALTAKNLSIAMSDDASAFIFTGSTNGYYFDITNVILTLIDASTDSDSPYPALIIDDVAVPITYTLTEDTSAYISPMAYPNTAFKGIVLKALYPTSNSDVTLDWLYFNHIKTPFTYFEAVNVSSYVDDASVTLQMIYTDVSIGCGIARPILTGMVDVSSYASDVSVGTGDPSNYISDTSVNNQTLNAYGLNNVAVADSSLIGNNIIDSSIYTSYIFDSSLTTSVINGVLAEQLLANDISIAYSNIFLSDISLNTITHSILSDSSIYSGVISDSSFGDSLIVDSSITDSYLYNTIINNGDIYNCEISRAVLNNDCSISSDSILLNSWINVYLLQVDASTIEYVTEGDLYTDASYARCYIDGNMNIWDCSINNAYIKDSSLYNCYVEDSSLINCTIYNTKYVDTYTSNVRDVKIDASIFTDVSIVYDTSTFYLKYSKTVDAGSGTCSTDNTINAGDYLYYLAVNNLWNKFSKIYMITEAFDNSNFTSKNYLEGMYIYNPHSFSIQIDYLEFV